MAKEPRSVSGKVAAVTGGARGIGRATAFALSRAGLKVAIGDLDLDLARRTAAEVGGNTVAFELDVTDREGFAAFVADVERELGPLDVLVNNAGIMPLAELHEESDETAIRQIDINVHGVITGTKLALRSMRPRRTGHIVNIASMAGKISPPGGATYVACKHAVVGLTESVALESEPLGIECTIVMPGIVNTELASGLEPGRGVDFAEPEDVADAIVDALRHPRLEVFVPKELKTIHKSTYVLPRRAQLVVAKLFKSTRVLQDIDHGRRRAYEDRAARSEPSVPEPVAGPSAPEAGAAAAEPVEATTA